MVDPGLENNGTFSSVGLAHHTVIVGAGRSCRDCIGIGVSSFDRLHAVIRHPVPLKGHLIRFDSGYHGPERDIPVRTCEDRPAGLILAVPLRPGLESVVDGNLEGAVINQRRIIFVDYRAVQDSRPVHPEVQGIRIGPGDPVLHTVCIGVPGPDIGEGEVGVGVDREGGLCAGRVGAIAVADAVDLRLAVLLPVDTDGVGVRPKIELTGTQVINPARLAGIVKAEISVDAIHDVVILSQKDRFVVIELAVGISRGAIRVEVVYT